MDLFAVSVGTEWSGLVFLVRAETDEAAIQVVRDYKEIGNRDYVEVEKVDLDNGPTPNMVCVGGYGGA